ncbi:MAG: alpha-galactosidase [Acidobacteria bacterium]|nr:alpha-galactosidase [Acidobacteriota bacterium]
MPYFNNRKFLVFSVGYIPSQHEKGFFINLLNIQSAGSKFLDFHWITGGENQVGSWVLKTEQLSTEKPRLFDSADPYPTTDACAEVVNNEINVKIFLGGHQVWPAANWRYIPSAAGVPVPFSTDIEVSQGDRLQFRTETNANATFDLAAYDPTIVYEDGETHIASKEFSGEQGRNGWRYQAIKNGTCVDLQYDAATRKWLYDREHVGAPFIGADNQQAGSVPVARIWTAPKPGKIRITGKVCNTGRPSYAKVGSSSYAPWVALVDRQTQDGVFIGWDYFGHWASSYALAADGGVSVKLHVAGFRRTLAPGESIVTPKAFVGLFRGDLDDAGHELLDWQYRYLWDYTRAAWFPGIRMLGYWPKGTVWGQPGMTAYGGNPDWPGFFPKVLRTVDLMRYVGGDAYDREWGWWDRAGDWNGPDFREAGRYLRKHQMGQVIYITPYMVDPKSNVAHQHPDWVLNNRAGEPSNLYGGTLDLSRPEVVDFVSAQLDEFVKRWGDFEMRDDFCFTSPDKGDETPLLGQDQGFREILQRFLDKHPASAFDGVNNGGNYIGYDYARYASAINFSDGAVGILRNYWESLLFPPDKSSDQPGQYNPDKYDKALSRGWLSINFEMLGDTWNPAKLEGLRELIDIYHYLRSRGVVGRWVRVYRPVVTGDDPTLYLERLSRDGLHGIIIPKRPAPHAITIKPKGLLSNQKYNVSYQESGIVQERAGADLMEKGIELEHMPEGELIYLNLPLHPGSKIDTAPPEAPSQVVKRRGENLTYPGIELQWKAGADDNWISYYEILRDGAVIGKVSKGTFYFDHSAGADLAADYELRTVDGAGNVSATSLAQGLAAKRSHIVDDAPGAGITFSPEWKHASETPLVAYQGTLTSATGEAPRRK